MSGWEQLQKHHFAFDFPKGLTNKKINEQIDRDLSTYSRISVINGESKSISKAFQLN